MLSYNGKAQCGLSKLLKDALLHCKAGDSTIKKRLRGIDNKFQNCSEGPTQFLSLHLSKCSQSNEYIDTKPDDKHVTVPAPPVWLVRFSLDHFWLCPIPFVLEYPNQPDHFSL